jgi:hypothetical protein
VVKVKIRIKTSCEDEPQHSNRFIRKITIPKNQLRLYYWSAAICPFVWHHYLNQGRNLRQFASRGGDMNLRLFQSSVKIAVCALAFAWCITTVVGCGANTNFTQGVETDTTMSAVSGTVHGGPNPVTNATVTLYATTNAAYGTGGTVLGTATTNASGVFSFTGTETACPAGQQAYIVSAGGYTGSFSASNTAALLMAAIGPCSGLSEGASGTHVIIDEPTTIAAAYALGQFMSITGTASAPVVNISAPANNNAATGSCTTSSVTHATTGCVAAGLAHAFLNAATLVSTNTGLANTAVSGTATAVVPQQLINTLANSVEACVNSSGSSSTPCQNLMTDTTPTTYNQNVYTSGAPVPTSTLQALQFLALYPGEAANPNVNAAPGTPPTGIQPSTTTTALYNIGSSIGYYSPSLTSAPLDFTIAIYYPAGANGAPWGISQDINDNVYVYGASTPPTIYSLSSNGSTRWTTAKTGGGGCATAGTRCGVIPDALGNLWVTDNAGVTELTTAGALGTTYAPAGGASAVLLDDASVDLGNNVWASAYNNTSSAPAVSSLQEITEGSTAGLAGVDVDGAIVALDPIKDPTFDSKGNMWVASESGGCCSAELFINTGGGLTSPTFGAYSGSLSDPDDYAAFSTDTRVNSPMIDATGNMWIGAQDGLFEVTGPAGTEAAGYGGSATAVYGGGSNVWDGGVERYSVMDGDGKIVAEAASGGFGFVTVYYPDAPPDALATDDASLAGANTYLNPCYVAPSTTVCALDADGGSLIMNAARMATVDASGAIWATLSSGGNVVQILGPGAPTWGQESYIQPGRPQ